MKKKKNPIVSIIRWCIIIFVIINILAGIVPVFKGTWEAFLMDENDTNYSDIEIADVSGQIVPDYEGVLADEGYQMYRFDVTVNNKGNRDEYKDYVLYIESGDGYALEERSGEYSSDAKDTRIIPRGRTAVITLYAQVSDDSTTVNFVTYYTPDDKESVFEYVLPDMAV